MFKPVRICFPIVCGMLLLIIVAPRLLMAQLPGNNAPVFSNHNSQNGFPAQAVYAIASDADGIMWIGSNLGLYRYDGLHFKNWNDVLPNQRFAESNRISSMLNARDGSVWVAYENGLSQLAPSGKALRNYVHNTSIPTGAPPGYAFRLFEDPSGIIWSCNYTNIITSLAPTSGKFKHYTVKSTAETLPKSIDIVDFHWVSDTLIWLSSRYDLLRFNPKTGKLKLFPIIEDRSTRSPHLITRLCADPINKRRIWIGTWGKGLISFDTQTLEKRSFEYESGIADNISNIIFDIAPKSDSTLWLGGRGLFQFHTQRHTFTAYRNNSQQKTSLVNDEVRSIHNDRQGKCWIGTADGFSVFDPIQTQVLQYHLPQGLAQGSLLYDAKSDCFYLATYYANRALHVFNRKLELLSVHTLPEADARYSEPFGLCADSKGRIWIATTHTGLWCFNPEDKKLSPVTRSGGRFNVLDLLATSMVCDKNDSLWIGTMKQGLLSCNTTNPKINAVPGVTMHVSGIHAASDGTLWLLSSDNQLQQFRPSDGKLLPPLRLNTKSSGRITSILDVAENRNGKLIVATRNQGIFELIKGELQPVKGLETLKNVHSLACDAQGNFWMLNPTQLMRFDVAKRLLHTFSKQSGIEGNLSQSDLLEFGSENLFFREGNKLVLLNTAEQNKAKPSYRILLNSVRFNETELLPAWGSLPKSLKLNHQQNYLGFDFQAVEYLHQDELQYAYMLEGLDPDWTFSGNRHFAQYQAIPPGNYVFRVKVSDRSGNWSSTELAFPVEIVPAWWQTLGFRLVLIFVSGVLMTLLVKYYATRKLRNRLLKLEQIQEIEGIRNRIARDIHDEIGSGLSKIALLSSGMERKLAGNDELGKTNRRIKQLSSEVIRSMGEIIWAVNPGNDSVSSLFAYMRNYLNQFAEETQIAVQIDMHCENSEDLERQLRPELKRNLLLIVKEALNNIQKHAQASEVHVRCNFGQSNVNMLIRDNGKGFTEAPRFNHGNGMKNMQKRASDLHGTFDVSFDSGTVIKLEFPWKE
jgi:signal transduction histidine kinase/ligand-binding sensor domain-containing protein